MQRSFLGATLVAMLAMPFVGCANKGFEEFKDELEDHGVIALRAPLSGFEVGAMLRADDGDIRRGRMAKEFRSAVYMFTPDLLEIAKQNVLEGQTFSSTSASNYMVGTNVQFDPRLLEAIKVTNAELGFEYSNANDMVKDFGELTMHSLTVNNLSHAIMRQAYGLPGPKLSPEGMVELHLMEEKSKNRPWFVHMGLVSSGPTFQVARDKSANLSAQLDRYGLNGRYQFSDEQTLHFSEPRLIGMQLIRLDRVRPALTPGTMNGAHTFYWETLDARGKDDLEPIIVDLNNGFYKEMMQAAVRAKQEEAERIEAPAPQPTAVPPTAAPPTAAPPTAPPTKPPTATPKPAAPTLRPPEPLTIEIPVTALNIQDPPRATVDVEAVHAADRSTELLHEPYELVTYPFRNGRPTGDFFQFRVTLKDPAFVYILTEDEAGCKQVLYPNLRDQLDHLNSADCPQHPLGREELLTPGTYSFPRDIAPDFPGWYAMYSDNVGFEFFQVYVSRERLPLKMMLDQTSEKAAAFKLVEELGGTRTRAIGEAEEAYQTRAILPASNTDMDAAAGRTNVKAAKLDEEALSTGNGSFSISAAEAQFTVITRVLTRVPGKKSGE